MIVLPHHWGCTGLFMVPSSEYPASIGSIAYPILARLVKVWFPRLVSRNVALVSRLSDSVGPPTVVGGITRIVVYPVNRQAVGIPVGKRPIFESREVVGPLRAHTDASATPVFIAIKPTIIASRIHALPNSMQPRSCFTVLAGRSMKLVRELTRGALRCLPVSKVAAGRPCLGSTVTNTQPECAPALSIAVLLQNSKAANTLSRHINQSRVFHERPHP